MPYEYFYHDWMRTGGDWHYPPVFNRCDTYWLTVSLKPKRGYMFTNDTEFYLNGQKQSSEYVTISDDIDEGTDGYLYADIPNVPCSPLMIENVDLDINLPVAGENLTDPKYTTCNVPNGVQYAVDEFYWWPVEQGNIFKGGVTAECWFTVTALDVDHDFRKLEKNVTVGGLKPYWVDVQTDKDTGIAYICGEVRYTVPEASAPTAAQLNINVKSYAGKGVDPENAYVNVQILDAATETVQTAKQSTGNDAHLVFENVPAGDYIVRVSKTKHADRDYAITVGDTDITLNTEILLYGDVTGDGVVSTADAMQITRKLNNKKGSFLTPDVPGYDADMEEYRMRVANVLSTDGLNASDAVQIRRYLNNKSSIFDSLP